MTAAEEIDPIVGAPSVARQNRRQFAPAALKKLIGPERNSAFVDLLIVGPAVIVSTFLLLKFHFFEAFVAFSNQYKDYQLDEIFVAGLPISSAVAWFSYRRWRESQNEIRRRQEAEHDRDTLREQLTQAQKLKAIGELAGGIAHDFNNLLMVIDGFGQRATANLDNPTILNECLEQIVLAGERGASMTRQLLVFSRRQVMEKTTVTVGELIDGLRGLLRHTTQARHEFRFLVEDPGAKIDTDPNEFTQAILNLAINARDAMPNGGDIFIGCKQIVDEADRTEWIRFSVTDTGEGMDAEIQKRIFEPFFTTKERHKGTGLGLSMVYGFVQSTGGRIEVSSTLGEGTEFRLFFPRSDAPVVRAKEADASDQYGMGETILVVEDNEPLLHLVKAQLDELGYKVLSANGGFAALEIDEGHEGSIDLLLTDIIMPGMSGIELARAMRETRPLIKTVFMSGFTEEAKMTGELPRGAIFLQKPIKMTHLAAVLRTTVEGDESLDEAV